MQPSVKRLFELVTDFITSSSIPAAVDENIDANSYGCSVTFVRWTFFSGEP